MTTPQWIDCEDGSITHGYLVETVHNGRTSWSIRERPLRTNQSNEARLTGWCGETDNKSRFARGVVRVISRNAGGDRARIAPVTGAELAAWLERDGHPELNPFDAPAAVSVEVQS